VPTGLPFSRWISKIDDKRHIPVNACILSSGVACCLALIYIGSMALSKGWRYVSTVDADFTPQVHSLSTP